MNTTPLRSCVPWIGGKHYLAPSIVKCFPEPHRYDYYVELFCGGVSVMLNKPRYDHTEIINDHNEWLINFWMTLRDYPQELERGLKSLPYSRKVFYEYRDSLFAGEDLPQVELAQRWFYVLYCSYRRVVDAKATWSNGLPGKSGNRGKAAEPHSYRNAVRLFERLNSRLEETMIDGRDFEAVFRQYDSPRTFLYCDPPYVGYENYYQPRKDGKRIETQHLEDIHTRLARCLNSAQSLVALSYYDDPLIDKLYPADKWRRAHFDVPKHTSRKQDKSRAHELLLMNFEPDYAYSLWSTGEAQEEENALDSVFCEDEEEEALTHIA